MFSLRILVPLLAITVLLVAPAQATISYYAGASGEASFNTAVGGLTLLNPALAFSSSDLASGGLYNASGTGISFLGFDDFNALTPLNFTVASGILTATASGEVVTIAFPAAGIYAFGTHITTTTGFGSWCIDLTTGGCNNNVLETAPTVVFFGFVSNTPVSASLYIHPTNSGPKIVLTNFEAFGPAAVPEPRTWLLVGVGLITLLLRRHLRAG
jgi:hypothetical protein